MPRTMRFSSKGFRLSYKNAQSMQGLADTLDCTLQTVYNYCERLGLKPIHQPGHNGELAKEIFNAYRGHRTIHILAKKYDKQPNSIRYYLYQELIRRKLKLKKLVYIKLWNELQWRPQLKRDPLGLARMAQVSELCAINYLRRKK